jgi:hypothetical protein
MASIPPVRKTGHVLRNSRANLRNFRQRRWFHSEKGGLSQQTRWKTGTQKCRLRDAGKVRMPAAQERMRAAPCWRLWHLKKLGLNRESRSR